MNKTLTLILVGALALLNQAALAAEPQTAAVLIVAATPGGVAAAVAAARSGSSVILLEESSHVGGIVAGGLTNTDIRKKGAVGGLFAEFVRRVREHYAKTYGADEGDVAALAGVPYRVGRESRATFGEGHAGVIYARFGDRNPLPGSTGAADDGIQAFCFRFHLTKNATNSVPVEKLAGYNRDDYRAVLDDIRAGRVTKLTEVIQFYAMPNGKFEVNSDYSHGEGLLVPVACSASHIGYQTIRIDPVFMALGEACGIAAVKAQAAQIQVRNVNVAEVQREIVKRGGVILYEAQPLVPEPLKP